MVFVEDESIALATNHTLTISVETKETTSKDSGCKWQTSQAGLISWSMKSENMFSVDGTHGIGYDVLFDYMVQRKPVTVVFSSKSVSEDESYEEGMQVPEEGWFPWGAVGVTMAGQVIITNLEANAPNGDNATFTVDFTGVGSLQNVSASYLVDDAEFEI